MTDALYTAEKARIHRETHKRYTTAGGCPKVSRYKSWCNGRIGHGGTHYALGLPSTAATHWTTDESADCPCTTAEGGGDASASA